MTPAWWAAVSAPPICSTASTVFGKDERAVGEAILERPAPHPAHDEVGAAGLAPEVVERDDVGVLEPGDELCLVLESTDERGIVGEIRMDDLDGDIAIHRGWIARYTTRSAPPELLAELVALRHAVAAVVHSGVVGGDHALELDELARRLEPDLVGEVSAVMLKGAQRVGLPTVAIESDEQLVRDVGAERELNREALELRRRLRRWLAGEQRLGSVLAERRGEAPRVGRLGRGPWLGRELVVRGAVPQGERFVEADLGGSVSPASSRECAAAASRSKRWHRPFQGRRRASSPARVDQVPIAKGEPAGATHRCAWCWRRSGGSSPAHTASISRSTDTTLPALTTRAASSRRCRGPPMGISTSRLQPPHDIGCIFS